MKESLKVNKSFVCSCGKDYTLEFFTDLAVDTMIVEARCPSCGEKRTITAGSLLVNSSPEARESSGDSEGLSFMDPIESGKSSDAESSNESIYTDMFDSQ